MPRYRVYNTVSYSGDCLMAHVLRITLILGAIICAYTGYSSNIPALVVGGMLLVVFFLCIHGKINDVLTSSGIGFTLFLAVLAVLFAAVGLYTAGKPLEPLTSSIEDTYKARNMFFFISFFFAAQIPCRLYAAYSEKKRAQNRASANNAEKSGAEQKPTISEIRYYDAQGKRCEKEYAVKAEILEYDENGKLLKSVIGRVAPTAKRSETADELISEIRKGLTGNAARDRAYLMQQTEKYRGHPQHSEIAKACGRMIAETLSQSELQEWERAMKADGPLVRNGTGVKAGPEHRENAGGAKPKLVLKRRSSGALLETDKPVTLIGSDTDSDFVLDNREVDAVNAILLYKNSRWYVANDLSHKTVSVNGKAVQPGERRELKRGDVLVIAGVETLEVSECRTGLPTAAEKPEAAESRAKLPEPPAGQAETGKGPADNPFSLRNVAAKMEAFLASGQISSAKALGDLIVGPVMAQKAEKIDGHTLQLTPLEWAMHAALIGHEEEKPKAEDDYTLFFLAYARTLQNTAVMDGGRERFMHQESAPFLAIAADLSPENADIWHLFANAAAAEGDDGTYLECMKRALLFAYEKTGVCSLAGAYEELGLYYAAKGSNLELASALYEAVKACGGESAALSFLLKKNGAAASSPDYKAVLQRSGIQVGFSPLASAAAQFLSNDKYREHLDDQTRRILRENSVPLP